LTQLLIALTISTTVKLKGSYQAEVSDENHS
jgi:hypothetical protein